MEPIRFKDVYVKKEQLFPPVKIYGQLEDCVCVNKCCGVGSLEWWMEEVGGDDTYMFVDLLFCPEIGIVYMMDYYGFRVYRGDFPQNDAVMAFYRPFFPKTKEQTAILEKVKETLATMTQLKVVVYNKGFFLAQKQVMKDKIMNQIAPLSRQLPKLCQSKICAKMVPSWMRFKHQELQWRYKWSMVETMIDLRRFYLLDSQVFDRLLAFELKQGNDWDVLTGRIACRNSGYLSTIMD
jgi:hypothetical protein